MPGFKTVGTKMVAFALGLATLTGAAACRQDGGEEGDEYRQALPTSETVALQVPGGTASGQALAVEAHEQALAGETSEFYQLTRQVSRDVNGGVVFVLGLVKAITRFPATSVGTDVAVWGPWAERDALARNMYRLTVRRTAPNQYEYALDGKDKAAPDTAFVTVLSGRHTPALDAAGEPIEGFGAGSFLLDFDKAATLPEHKDTDRGTAEVTYQRPSLTMPVAVTAKFRGAWDDKERRLIDVDYAYGRGADGAGTMDFTYARALGRVVAGSDPGKMKVRSRWTNAGAGRSDVQAQIPEGTFTLSECWNASFASVFRVASWDAAAGWGTEEACAFAAAEYSSLTY